MVTSNPKTGQGQYTGKKAKRNHEVTTATSWPICLVILTATTYVAINFSINHLHEAVKKAYDEGQWEKTKDWDACEKVGSEIAENARKLYENQVKEQFQGIQKSTCENEKDTKWEK